MTTNTSAKIVNTVYGAIDGNTVTLDDGTVINSWYGVPYAAPPVGDLRFEVMQYRTFKNQWVNFIIYFIPFSVAACVLYASKRLQFVPVLKTPILC